MNDIFTKLNIDDDTKTFTHPVRKDRKFTHFNDTSILAEDFNFQADLLFLPETETKYKYLLVAVDIATREIDFEPLKNKEPKTILKAFFEIFKRPILNKPKATIQTDSGTEFMGQFHNWLYNENILHNVKLPGRHSQQSIVENANKKLGNIISVWLKSQTKRKGTTDWTTILPLLRTELNKDKQHLNLSDAVQYFLNSETYDKKPKYKVGDLVHRLLDTPEDTHGDKLYGLFRVGDYRWETIPRKIIKIIQMFNNKVIPHRYILEGLPNVSFTERQLMPSKEIQPKYRIREIIGKRKRNGRIEYLIWWKGYKKDKSTWERRVSLIDDGNKSLINEYEKRQ